MKPTQAQIEAAHAAYYAAVGTARQRIAAALTSAAEVGEQDGSGHPHPLKPIVNATIERCAQALADYWKIAPYSPLPDLLAAIRKVKEGK